MGTRGWHARTRPLSIHLAGTLCWPVGEVWPLLKSSLAWAAAALGVRHPHLPTPFPHLVSMFPNQAVLHASCDM